MIELLVIWLNGIVMAVFFATQKYAYYPEIIGGMSVSIFMIFIVSPLLSIFRAIKEKNAIYFYYPFIFANATVWTLYGYYIQDFFVIFTNAVGLISGFIQLMCKILFKSIPEKDPAPIMLYDDVVIELSVI